MGHRVFISYAREDAAFARRLAKDLTAAGIAIWLDQIDIRAGDLWDHTVETALAGSEALVVVLTPSSVASRSVLDEVAYALDENKTVAPVLYRQCSIPLRLRRLHYIDFTVDYTAGFEDLRRALASRSAPVPAASATVTAHPRGWESEARALVSKGQKINAIKLVRDRTGMGLKEAKDLVESW